MALDAEHGIVYAPTGSAVMDFYGGDRVGDDLYANTLLALDADTGKLLWHFQGVHHDIWDRDFPSPPALFTVKHNGKRIEALAQTTKQGYLYLFDRITGQPLFPIHEHPYPASTVPGEVTSPTQPLPDWPAPFARQRLTEDMLTTRTPEAHAWAVKAFHDFRSDGQFIPFALDKQTVVFPGFDGGAEWGGPAIDPVAHVLYRERQRDGVDRRPGSRRAGRQSRRAALPQPVRDVSRDRSRRIAARVSVADRRRQTAHAAEDHRHHPAGHGQNAVVPQYRRAAANQRLLDYLRTASAPWQRTGRKKELASVPAEGKPPSRHPMPRGRQSIEARCAICHGDHMEGIPPSFPMLVGVGSRLSEAQVTGLIHSGKGRMPPMPDVQGAALQALLRYLGVNTVAQSGPEESAADKYIFTGYRKFLDPDGYPAFVPPWGTLSAIDLKTGKYLWKIPLGEYPDLAQQGMKNTGSENYGGPIVTAGGVLFIGATVFDRTFRALDSRTGNLLWQNQLPFAGMATPATYMVNGRQFVVIASSGGRDPKSPVGGAYIAFALPR